jgi:hypothetical protein
LDAIASKREPRFGKPNGIFNRELVFTVYKNREEELDGCT